MTFEIFVKTYLGKSTDYDGAYGVQCVDLAKLYIDKVFGIKPQSIGNAHCYFDNFAKHKFLTDNFKKISNCASFIPKKGDICVWSTKLSSGGTGHIAIATGEGNTSTFYSYDQNWGEKKMKKVKHTYSCFLGVLRPNKQYLVLCPTIKVGNYKLTNSRGLYNGAGAASGRKTVKDIPKASRSKLTKTALTEDAYYKANAEVKITKTELSNSGNLFAYTSEKGWFAVWEYKNNKKFIF